MTTPRNYVGNCAQTDFVAHLRPAPVMTEYGVTEVTQGERAEIWVRAPHVMKGYWKKPKATRETITPDGWLKMGDSAYYDKETEFFIVDRKKELIKVRGNQVAPEELEALLLEHLVIADVAVIGVAGKDGEEMPSAYDDRCGMTFTTLTEAAVQLPTHE